MLLLSDEHGNQPRTEIDWMIGKILCVAFKNKLSAYTIKRDHSTYSGIFRESQLRTTVLNTGQADISVIKEYRRRHIEEFENNELIETSDKNITNQNSTIDSLSPYQPIAGTTISSSAIKRIPYLASLFMCLCFNYSTNIII